VEVTNRGWPIAIENRNGPVVDAVRCNGTAERDAALEMAGRIAGDQRVTVGGDKGYDTRGFVQEMPSGERSAQCFIS
jgi:hypothetical protein